MSGKRYLTGEYLKYYEEFSSSDVNGAATNFKSDVETLSQELANVKNVIVNWSGEGALALSNNALTSIFNKFDVIQQNIDTALLPATEAVESLKLELELMKEKEELLIQKEEELEAENAKNIPEKISDGKDKDGKVIYKTNPEYTAWVERKEALALEIQELTTLLDDTKLKCEEYIEKIVALESSMTEFSDYLGITKSVLGLDGAISSEYSSMTLEQRLEVLNSVLENYKEVLNELNQMYEQAYGKGFSFSSKDFENVYMLFDAFDLFYKSGTDIDEFKGLTRDGNNILMKIDALTKVMTYCRSTGAIQKITDYLNGESWEESGLAELYEQDGIFKYTEKRFEKRMRVWYGVDNPKEYLRSNLTGILNSWENLDAAYTEYEAMRETVGVMQAKVDNFEKAIKLLPYEIHIEDPEFISKYKDGVYGDFPELDDIFNDNMTDTEKALYSYLKATKGVDYANEYLELMEDPMNMREGMARAKEYVEWIGKDGFQITDIALSGAEGFKDGVRTFFDGIGDLFRVADTQAGTKSALDYELMYKAQYMLDMADSLDIDIDPNLRNLLNQAYQTGSTVGTMAVPMIAGAIPGVGQALSTVLMTASFAGNAAVEGRQNGLDVGAAYLYGAISGGSEVILEKTLGRVPFVGDLSGSLIKDMAGEMLEEGIQAYVDAGLGVVFYGDEFDFKETTANAWESAKQAAISTPFMQGFGKAVGVGVGTTSRIAVNTFTGGNYTTAGVYEMASQKVSNFYSGKAEIAINTGIEIANENGEVTMLDKVFLDKAIKNVSVEELSHITSKMPAEGLSKLVDTGILSKQSVEKLNLADTFAKIEKQPAGQSLDVSGVTSKDLKAEVTRDGKSLSEYIASNKRDSVTQQTISDIKDISRVQAHKVESTIKSDIKAEAKQARHDAIVGKIKDTVKNTATGIKNAVTHTNTAQQQASTQQSQTQQTTGRQTAQTQTQQSQTQQTTSRQTAQTQTQQSQAQQTVSRQTAQTQMQQGQAQAQQIFESQTAQGTTQQTTTSNPANIPSLAKASSIGMASAIGVTIPQIIAKFGGNTAIGKAQLEAHQAQVEARKAAKAERKAQKAAAKQANDTYSKKEAVQEQRRDNSQETRRQVQETTQQQENERNTTTGRQTTIEVTQQQSANATQTNTRTRLELDIKTRNASDIKTTLSTMTPSEIASTLDGMKLKDAVYARQQLDAGIRTEVILEEGMLAARGKYNGFFKNFREHAGEHTNAVTEYALKIARESGIELNLAEVEYGARFHDLGMRGGVYLDANGEYSSIDSQQVAEGESEGLVRGITARSNHPLNSAISILMEKVAPAGVDSDVVALLAISHSKSTSGITDFSDPLHWKYCVEKLEAAVRDVSKNEGIEIEYHPEKLIAMINDPATFARLQAEALCIRDGDAMSELAYEGDPKEKKTIMQTGDHTRIEDKPGEGRTRITPEMSPEEKVAAFNEALRYQDAKAETASFTDTIYDKTGQEIEPVTNKVSKRIHAGELNVGFDSRYNATEGRYVAAVKVLDANQRPFATLEAIRERLGEAATYGNCVEVTENEIVDRREVIIMLPTEAKGTVIGNTYEATLKQYKDAALTDDTLSPVQKAFYAGIGKNVRIVYTTKTDMAEVIETEVEYTEGNRLESDEGTIATIKRTELVRALMQQDVAKMQEVLSRMTPSEIAFATTSKGITLKEAVQIRSLLDSNTRLEVIFAEGQAVANGKYKGFFKNFREHAELHTNLVTDYALRVAKESGIELNIAEVEYGARFHDLGMRGGVYLSPDGTYRQIDTQAVASGKKETVVRGMTARKNHPLNSAISILMDKVTPEGVDSDVVALLAISHSKSTSGITDFSNPEQWKSCVEKLEAAVRDVSKNEGIEIEYHPEKLIAMINDPATFARLQAEALCIRDGDAMSELAYEGEASKGQTIMQTGRYTRIVDNSGEGRTRITPEMNPEQKVAAFNEEIKYNDAESEAASFTDTIYDELGMEVEKVENGISKKIHAGELNVEFDSSYNGREKSYVAVIRPLDANRHPMSTLDAINERLGEVATYGNCVETTSNGERIDRRKVIIALPVEAKGTKIAERYLAQIEEFKRAALTDDKLSPSQRDFYNGLGSTIKIVYTNETDLRKIMSDNGHSNSQGSNGQSIQSEQRLEKETSVETTTVETTDVSNTPTNMVSEEEFMEAFVKSGGDFTGYSDKLLHHFRTPIANFYFNNRVGLEYFPDIIKHNPEVLNLLLENYDLSLFGLVDDPVISKFMVENIDKIAEKIRTTGATFITNLPAELQVSEKIIDAYIDSGNIYYLNNCPNEAHIVMQEDKIIAQVEKGNIFSLSVLPEKLRTSERLVESLIKNGEIGCLSGVLNSEFVLNKKEMVIDTIRKKGFSMYGVPQFLLDDYDIVGAITECTHNIYTDLSENNLDVLEQVITEKIIYGKEISYELLKYFPTSTKIANAFLQSGKLSKLKLFNSSILTQENVDLIATEIERRNEFSNLEKLPEYIRDSSKIVSLLIERNAISEIQGATNRAISESRDTIISAIKNGYFFGSKIDYIANAFKADQEIISLLVKNGGLRILNYVDQETIIKHKDGIIEGIKNDREFLILKTMPEEIRTSKEIVKEILLKGNLKHITYALDAAFDETNIQIFAETIHNARTETFLGDLLGDFENYPLAVRNSPEIIYAMLEKVSYLPSGLREDSTDYVFKGITPEFINEHINELLEHIKDTDTVARFMPKLKISEEAELALWERIITKEYNSLNSFREVPAHIVEKLETEIIGSLRKHCDGRKRYSLENISPEIKKLPSFLELSLNHIPLYEIFADPILSEMITDQQVIEQIQKNSKTITLASFPEKYKSSSEVLEFLAKTGNVNFIFSCNQDALTDRVISLVADSIRNLPESQKNSVSNSFHYLSSNSRIANSSVILKALVDSGNYDGTIRGFNSEAYTQEIATKLLEEALSGKFTDYASIRSKLDESKYTEEVVEKIVDAFIGGNTEILTILPDGLAIKYQEKIIQNFPYDAIMNHKYQYFTLDGMKDFILASKEIVKNFIDRGRCFVFERYDYHKDSLRANCDYFAEKILNGDIKLDSNEITPANYEFLSSPKVVEALIRTGNLEIMKRVNPEAITEANINLFAEQLRQGGKISSLVVFPEVIRNNELIIETLIQTGNVSVLTGLPNEFYYQHAESISNSLEISEESYREKLDKLLSINDEIFSTLNLSMLSNKMSGLGLEFIERCALYSDIQQTIVDLSNNPNNLQAFIKIANTLQENVQNTDLNGIVYRILNNGMSQSSGFTTLINNLDINSLNKGQITTLIKVLQSKNNLYQIQTMDDLNPQNYIAKKNQYFSNMREKVENGSLSLEEMKQLVAAKLFDLDYELISFMDQRYNFDMNALENLDNQVEKEELAEVIGLLKAINSIVRTDDINTLRKIYLNTDTILNNNLINNLALEETIRSKYAELFSNTLYTPQENHLSQNTILKNVRYRGNDIKVYEVADAFRMQIHSLGAYREFLVPENFKTAWLRPKIAFHGICTSYIGNDLISPAFIGHPVLGFSEYEGSSLLLSGNYDLFSDSAIAKYETSMAQSYTFLPPSMMIDYTRHNHNEMVLERRKNTNEPGEISKRLPNYIVYFVEDMGESQFSDSNTLWNETKQAASDFGVPIVVVNRAQYLQTEMDACKKLEEEFFSSNSPEILRKLMNKYINNSVGCRFLDATLKKGSTAFSTTVTQDFYGRVLERVETLLSNNQNTEAANLINELLNIIEKEHRATEISHKSEKLEKTFNYESEIKRLELLKSRIMN